MASAQKVSGCILDYVNNTDKKDVYVQFTFAKSGDTENFRVRWYHWYGDRYKDGTRKYIQEEVSDVKPADCRSIKSSKYFQIRHTLPNECKRAYCTVKPIAEWKDSSKHSKGRKFDSSATHAKWNGKSYIKGPDINAAEDADEIEPPSNVAAAYYPQTDSIHITWDRPTDERIKYVRIYRWWCGKKRTDDNRATEGSWINAQDASYYIKHDKDGVNDVYDGRFYAFTMYSYAKKNGAPSEMSDITDDVKMPPRAPEKLTAQALTSSSVKLQWEEWSFTGDSYEVSWSEDKDAWANNDTKAIETLEEDWIPSLDSLDVNSESTLKIEKAKSSNVAQVVHTISGLDMGKTWYFRVRHKESSISGDAGFGGYSDIVSALIGSTPTAPTLIPTERSYAIGDEIDLSWVHNNEDNSEQASAVVTLIVKTGGKESVQEVEVVGPEQRYRFNTAGIAADSTVTWTVRTAGITGAYGPDAAPERFDVYQRPVMRIASPAVATSMPLHMELAVTPTTQTALSMHMEVTAAMDYTYTDVYGNDRTMPYGAVVCRKTYYFPWDFNNTNVMRATVTFADGNFAGSLQDGIPYNIRAWAHMDSGLTTEVSVERFVAMWSDDAPGVDCAVMVNGDDMTATIEASSTYFDEEEEKWKPTPNTVLSVYRIDSNGGFVAIAEGLPNTGGTLSSIGGTVVDPHPNYRSNGYRIVATKTDTDVSGYEDIVPDDGLEDVITDGPHDLLILQWGERVTESEEGVRTLTQNIATFPYDLRMDESYEPDVTLREYIGREHPVAYWGTQKGHTASWSTDLVRYNRADEGEMERLRLLRELAGHMGEVYVREPTGTGYWAYVKVNISHSYDDLHVGVSLDITRIEVDRP